LLSQQAFSAFISVFHPCSSVATAFLPFFVTFVCFVVPSAFLVADKRRAVKIRVGHRPGTATKSWSAVVAWLLSPRLEMPPEP
jgi:hypothetical protein